MKSVGINYTKITGQEISLCKKISLGSENILHHFAFISSLNSDMLMAGN